jgi:periplasmic mercuric ion binding protein
MRLARLVLFAGLSCLVVPVAAARAETKVELKGVHLCCPACVAAVRSTLKGVEGVQVACDSQKKIVSITAVDDSAAQKALDALAAHGFHGDTGSSTLAIKDDSGVSAGKVTKLTVTGIHNCCGACNAAIKNTVKKVDGVKNDTARPRATSFTVSGNFDAAELVKALNAAGFHVKVQQ